MQFSLDKALGIHPESVRIYAKRMEILANNMANADTPGFKSRDINFRQIMQRATRPEGSVQLQKTQAGHLETGNRINSWDLKYRVPLQPSANGNTVDTQMEISAFSENSLRYMASMNFLNGRVRGLLNAIRGET